MDDWGSWGEGHLHYGTSFVSWEGVTKVPGHPAAELAAALHLLSLSGADWALAPFSQAGLSFCSHLEM